MNTGMRGLCKSASKLVRGITFAIAIGTLASCSASKESTGEKPSPEPTELKKFESTFRPSDYDLDVKVFLAELRKEKDKTSEPPEPAVVVPPVVVNGYRVQMFSTTNIDEANARKAEVESAFPAEWFYIEFDAPAYKLRAGNFLNRSDAQAYAKMLAEQGFPDAWVVPDKVFKNMPPRNLQTNENR